MTIARFVLFGQATFLFAVMLPDIKAYAATANAAVSAEVISPTSASIDAAAELLKSASTGMLTLSIPGAGALFASKDGGGSSVGTTLSPSPGLSAATAGNDVASSDFVLPTSISGAGAAAASKDGASSDGTTPASVPGDSAPTASGDSASSGGVTLTSTGVRGNSIVFSTTDTASLASIVTALAASGGSIQISGIMSSGRGVSLTISHAVNNGNGSGTVLATVAYD